MTQASCIYICPVMLPIISTFCIYVLALMLMSTSAHYNWLLVTSSSSVKPHCKFSFIWDLSKSLVSCFTIMYHLLGAGRFDLKHTKILRLWPASTLMSPFSTADNFSAKVIIYFHVDVILLWLIYHPAAEPTELIIPLDENIQTFVAPFVQVNNPRLLLLITFSLEFSLPNIFPCAPSFSLLCNIKPPLLNNLPQGLMGAQQYKFPFIPVAGPDDTAALYPTDWRALWCRFTVHGSHSGAAAHLEWSTLTENRGQPWPKQV